MLGQGGFGQVLEVVKRDCGKHYAMKVMHKEMMRRCLGSSWRKKIWLEKDLMQSLCHPFLVNLLYSFQNQEFLVLVMDLVPAGDLSEFLASKVSHFSSYRSCTSSALISASNCCSSWRS